MSFARKSDQWPILRKVFRLGRQYVCGICRAPFESHGAALSCLQECWQEVLREDGVATRPSAKGQQGFRCRFCSRDYSDRGQASACAKACRERLMARADEDSLLPADAAGPRGTANRPAPRQPMARARRSVAARPSALSRPSAPSRHPERSEGSVASPQPKADLQSDIVRQITATAESKTVQVIKTDEFADGPSRSVRGRPRTEFKKTFIRDGAKYVCSYCRKNYFTKGEVEACFDTHFDPNGYEIVQG